MRKILEVISGLAILSLSFVLPVVATELKNFPDDTFSSVGVMAGSEPRYMDPGLNQSEGASMYISHCFEGLTRIDKKGKIAPGMAEKWAISSDGLTYLFHLRKAKWSDGQPVKAQDFEYAWKRVLDPNTASESAYMLYYLANGEDYNMGKTASETVGVKALNDQTLEVRLKSATVYFTELFSCKARHHRKTGRDMDSNVSHLCGEWGIQNDELDA